MMLLFNQAIEAVIHWPEFLIEDTALAADTSLPERNLYFLYFGLCTLGLGSVVYGAFCPREINDVPNIERYVLNTPSVGSSVIAKDDLRTILNLRFEPEPSATYDIFDSGRLDYPAELAGDFHHLMEELYRAVDVEGVVDPMPEVMLGSGYLDFTRLACRVWMNVRAEWGYTLAFYDAAPKFARDVAYVKYKFLDYTRFRVRATVAVIYAVGFALVLKPTLHVFLLLATAWLR